MKLVQEVEKTVKDFEIVDRICNKCGLSIVHDRKQPETYGLHIEYSGGYESAFNRIVTGAEICDGETYEADVCEVCLTEFFKSFKVPVSRQSYMGRGDDSAYNTQLVDKDGKLDVSDIAEWEDYERQCKLEEERDNT